MEATRAEAAPGETAAAVIDWVAHPDRLQVQVWPAGLTPHPGYPVGWHERQPDPDLPGMWRWVAMFDQGRPGRDIDADGQRTLRWLVLAHPVLSRIAGEYGIGARP